MLQTAPRSKKTTSKKAAHDRFIYRHRLEAAGSLCYATSARKKSFV